MYLLPGRAILCLDTTFVPKINTWFHRAQEVILPDFCPKPRHPRECPWHSLNVRRALRKYITKTAPFRRIEALFVSFQPRSMGTKVTPSTIGRWLKACIGLAHDYQAWSQPGRMTAHSTQSAATTVAWPLKLLS